MSLTDWDIHHIVTGGEFKIKRSSVTVGLGLSFGGRDFLGAPQLLDWGGADWPSDPFEGLRFRYTTFKLIVGFAI
jgi:hypothetical protein